MAFLAALPELAEAGEAAGAAGGAAGAAGGAAEGGGGGGGLLSKAKSLFGKTGAPGGGEQNKQQNVGESRNLNFQESATAARGALRGGMD